MLVLLSAVFLSTIPLGIPTTVSAKATVRIPMVPPNFLVQEDKSAASLVPHWVHLINERKYDEAAALWTPDRAKDEKSPLSLKHLQNYTHVTLLQYKDVTSTWGGIPMDLSRFYQLKVYIAVLNYEVKDKELAGSMVGKKIQRCFVVRQTQNSPWQLFMMQGYTTFSANPAWQLDLEGVTNNGRIYRPAGSPQILLEDFIKQDIGSTVQQAVNQYYGVPRRIAYWQMYILDITRLNVGSYRFEITVRVNTSSGSFNPPYGVETITLTNVTKPGERPYKVVRYVHNR
ncbi:DUF3888 domain-containing protein [Alicyclobacillus ferrooxydans]|uniref:DUF3888 domain-containing protein n=1 Tax=Alicyclobacillus ferrooxydans TaxID=471514 RepID=UPI001FDFF74F|nr:DUF3888 domain-containing protein [Alicyclobacillus ferrooxydans]